MNLFKFALGSVTFLINLYANYYEHQDLSLTLKELENDAGLPRIRTYDFIIGGGGAGCVLANRLSKRYKVLVLESGGTPVPVTQALIHYPEVTSNTRINNIFKTVPSTTSGLAYGGVHVEPTGRMLGGSTSHNGLIFNRGHPTDFDKWAELTGDDSWKYENVLQYFKKSETYVGRYDNNRQKLQHGTSGPMIIDTAETPFLKTWLMAGSELGFNTSYDPNGPQAEGFVAEAVSQKKGRRVSSYTAYIQSIKNKRPKLKIERYSTVSEILINKQKRACGVLYRRHGIPQIAHASEKVILSCGPISTPLLLMKSGVGPAKVLKEAGIPVVKDLPVGVGITEHPSISLPHYSVSQNSEHLFINLKRDLTEDALIKFHENGTGPLAVSLEGQAFVVSSRAKEEGERNWPDLVVQMGQPLYYFEGQTPSYWLGVTLGQPKGKGILSLNTTAYKHGLRRDEELAILDLKILTDPSDVDVLLEGIKLWLIILEKTKAFQKFGMQIQDPKLSQCSLYKFRSDDYWRCYIRQTSGISFHVTSSCRMGFGAGDSGAVVDSKLNVLGIEGLKIVDASIMPNPPNANPTAAVVMLAEKAAAEILGTTYELP